jgi:hypothetical protein
MAQGEPLECTLMARGVDMNYFEATVEAPFNGHAPTPQIKQQLIDEFITMALNANPNGTQGEPEIVSSCLVTGQSFAITLRIGLVDNGEPRSTSTSRTA